MEDRAPPARGISPKTDGVPGPGSVSRWDRLGRDIAEEHGLYLALTNLVGSEGGKLFPGGSFVAGPKGDVRGRAPLWNDAILSVSVDLDDVTRARADMPLIADLETMMPHLSATIDEPLVPAKNMRLSFIRGGLHVSGNSDGASLVAIGALFPQARALMWIYAVLIALSRIVVTAHHPSDVVAAAAVGVAGAWLVRQWFAARGLGFAVTANGAVRPMPGPNLQRIIKALARRLHAA